MTRPIPIGPACNMPGTNETMVMMTHEATGHWRLLRHGGRGSDRWRDLKCPDEEKDARKLYEAEAKGMRQGGLRLIAPDGRVAAATRIRPGRRW